MNDPGAHDAFAVDPLSDPRGWEDRVQGVMAAAANELDRRREGAGVVWTVLDWARPALSAAATVAILVTAALAASMYAGERSETEPLTVAVMPETIAAWLMAGYQPTVSELVIAAEAVGR